MKGLNYSIYSMIVYAKRLIDIINIIARAVVHAGNRAQDDLGDVFI